MIAISSTVHTALFYPLCLHNIFISSAACDILWISLFHLLWWLWIIYLSSAMCCSCRCFYFICCSLWIYSSYLLYVVCLLFHLLCMLCLFHLLCVVLVDIFIFICCLLCLVHVDCIFISSAVWHRSMISLVHSLWYLIIAAMWYLWIYISSTVEPVDGVFISSVVCAVCEYLQGYFICCVVP